MSLEKTGIVILLAFEQRGQANSSVSYRVLRFEFLICSWLETKCLHPLATIVIDFPHCFLASAIRSSISSSASASSPFSTRSLFRLRRVAHSAIRWSFISNSYVGRIESSDLEVGLLFGERLLGEAASET